MALPNGDLITTVFDPQMAYPVDKRMQVDTLNSRDSMSMFIRWEGMEVYVLENKTKYILQGGRSNEFWKEQGTGSGTGGTTFVGQFATADLLPTSGRSSGDYAFVGTGDDFVQYNWDNIANEWVMAEGQTDMASEFFHIGYKTPLRRPVIFPLFPKDVIVETSGDFVFAPETAVARFIFTGEVTAIRGIETAASDREIKLVNRTGSDIPLRDKASGIPSDSGFDFGGTDYTWVNGSEITLKGNGTYWQLAPNNQIAFSDHLDSVNAKVSVGSDGMKVWTGFIDSITKVPVTFKQLDYTPSFVDGRIYRQIDGEYFGDAEFLETRVFNVFKLGADTRGINYSDISLERIKLLMEDGDKIVFPHGDYNFQNTHTFTKNVDIDFGNSNITGLDRDRFIFSGTEKSTHTVTADYVRGRNYLTLNNTSGIQVGDLINIISTELYNTSRDYYYKGGNSVVNRIDGNNVYFSLYMPFDMVAGTIEVKIYKPIMVRLSNLNLDSDTALASTLYGIRLMYAVDSTITGINTKNYKYNIDIFRCVDCVLNNITTGHAKTISDTWDGYGIAIESSTNISLNHVRTKSGQHGVTTGGREVNYNTTFQNCDLQAETTSRGFGSHSNVWNMSFRDSTIHGMWLCGNVSMENCDITDGGDAVGYELLDVAETTDRASYSFKDVRFSRNIHVRDGGAQQPSPNNIYVGSIKFDNCKDFYIRQMVAFYNTEKRGETKSITMKNCQGVLFESYDNIGLLDIKNSKAREVGTAGINQVEGKIITVNLNELTLYRRPLSLVINNADWVNFAGLKWSTELETGGGGMTLSNIKYLSFVDTDMTGVERGLNSYDNIQNVDIYNSKIKFRLTSVYNSFLSSTTSFTAIGFTNVDIGALVDIQTDEGGVKRIKSINSSGWLKIDSRLFQPIRTDRATTQVNTTLQSIDFDRYVRFQAANPGTATIPPDVFKADDEIIGENEGNQKTFVAGTGVTLRTPVGQDLILPTGSRFIIKFKSANDALVTIIKPYTITGVTTFPELTDTPANYTGHKNKSVKVNNEETALVFVADGVDLRNITDGGSIAPTLTDGFIGSRLNFTSSTAVTLQGFTSAGGQSSLTLVNPHATNNLTLVHNGSGTVKYIDAGATDLVIAPKTAVKVEIVGNEIYRVL